MATKSLSKGGIVILLSFAVGMILNILPLPEAVEIFRPDWVAMILIYWVMALPNRIGVLVGWSVGLIVDVLSGSLLGVHALTLALTAYLIQMIYHRLRLFPRWKQALNVAVVVGIHRLVANTLMGLFKPNATDLTYWFPLLGIVIFWPWIFVLLRDVRRKYC